MEILKLIRENPQDHTATIAIATVKGWVERTFAWWHGRDGVPRRFSSGLPVIYKPDTSRDWHPRDIAAGVHEFNPAGPPEVWRDEAYKAYQDRGTVAVVPTVYADGTVEYRIQIQLPSGKSQYLGSDTNRGRALKHAQYFAQCLRLWAELAPPVNLDTIPNNVRLNSGVGRLKHQERVLLPRKSKPRENEPEEDLLDLASSQEVTQEASQEVTQEEPKTEATPKKKAKKATKKAKA